MITDDSTKQAVYQHLLRTTNRRLEQALPGSSEGAFAHLSLAAVLNLLLLMRGEWGSFSASAPNFNRSRKYTRVLLRISIVLRECLVKSPWFFVANAQPPELLLPSEGPLSVITRVVAAAVEIGLKRQEATLSWKRYPMLSHGGQTPCNTN